MMGRRKYRGLLTLENTANTVSVLTEALIDGSLQDIDAVAIVVRPTRDKVAVEAG